VGDGDPAGFAWLAVDDTTHSVLAFERRVPGGDGVLVCVANLSGLEHRGYRIGLPEPGSWRGLLSTDEARFVGAGSWVPNLPTEAIAWQGRPQSVVVDLPPLTVVYLVPDR
jgi:1,4-alpha-glucan branching enzyme